jgi:hypothetical protein
MSVDKGPKSVRGISHVAEKLEKTIVEGDYYHALQMYKTLYARFVLVIFFDFWRSCCDSHAEYSQLHCAKQAK